MNFPISMTPRQTPQKSLAWISPLMQSEPEERGNRGASPASLRSGGAQRLTSEFQKKRPGNHHSDISLYFTEKILLLGLYLNWNPPPGEYDCF